MSPNELKKLIIALIAIPSVTESSKENDAAAFIQNWLGELQYFRDRPEHLAYIPTPLEGRSEYGLHAVVARVDAAVPTKKTVLLVSHFDVVDTHVYGADEDAAYAPEELAKRLLCEELDTESQRDLHSGNFLFGRGSMDMKCGVAIEMALLADYANDRSKFDVNIIVAFVGDEENSSAGMRGVASYLAGLARDEELEFAAAINTEPCEPGRPGDERPLMFLGSMGKLMPAFYVLGHGSHVGNYYHGFSAALVASRIVALAEGRPKLVDAKGDETPPPWTCLEIKLIKDGYTVTVPDRAAVYFNCFVTNNAPSDVAKQMKRIAKKALNRSITQIKKSFAATRKLGYAGDMDFSGKGTVMSYEDLLVRAKENYVGDLDAHLAEFAASLTVADLRDRGIAVIGEAARIAGAYGPLVVTAFLPPYLPVRSDLTDAPADKALVAAAKKVAERAKSEHGIDFGFVEFFAGLCDLSYTGLPGDASALDVLEKNMPGWGSVYSVPLDDLRTINMPVINLGPLGRDAHKKTERLELRYSLEILPGLIDDLIREISLQHRTKA